MMLYFWHMIKYSTLYLCQESKSNRSRKEFFNVSLEEIEIIVKEHKGEIEFTKIAEAKEYRETLAIIKEREKKNTIEEEVEKEFPKSL